MAQAMKLKRDLEGLGSLPAESQEMPDVRQRVEVLLAKAEAAPSGGWRISNEEHAALASVAEIFDVELPVGALQSPEEAAVFLRLALRAMSD
jgi:hypothetical protein